jgi:hypothetical protein
MLEEQLRREEERLKEIELKMQREINEKRQELLVRENLLNEIETRMHGEQRHSFSPQMETAMLKGRPITKDSLKNPNNTLGCHG